MSISFQCTGCGRTLKVADELAGRKAKCPQCHAILYIPEGPAAAITPAPAAAPMRRRAAPLPPDEPDAGTDMGEDMERRPRRRKKVKKSLLLPMLIIGGVALLVLVTGVTLGAIFVLPMLFGGGADDIYFMPDNSQIVGQVRLEQLMNSDAVKQVRTQFPQFDDSLKQLTSESGGMDLTAIDRVFVGGSSPAGAPGNANMIVVIHTNKSMNVADIETGAKKGNANVTFTEAKVGKYTVYDAKASGKPSPFAAPPMSFTLVNDKEVVMGPSSVLHTVLERDKKPDVSDKLRAAMDKADFNATVALAMNLKAMMPAQPAMPAGKGGPAAMPANPAAKVDGVAITAKVGTDVDLTVTALCQDPAAATDLSGTIKTGLDQFRKVMGAQTPPELADLLKIDPQVSGANVTVTKTIKVAPLLNLAKGQQKGAPFNPFSLFGR